MWDAQKAVQYVNEHAESSSTGYCARYVKNAINSGGDISSWPSIVSAKDYGPALVERGFEVITAPGSFIAGDVVIIQGIKKSDFPVGEIKKDHPHGHMAMFNGQQWVSDFKQNNGYYPGGDYRRAKPSFVFYRHKDVTARLSESRGVPAASTGKICFPARKQNGENYATLDEMIGLIGLEPHGSWLAGTNKMWHGGIHITQKSAPGSVLTAETMESAVPLQCMADGEVVAWRLNKDYQKSTFLGQSIQYTTTFVLVKSVCQPDPNNEQTWLEFYSLYMGLAPLSTFEKHKCMVAKTKVSKRKVGNYEGSQSAGSHPPAPTRTGELAQGKRVLILKEAIFMNKPVSPQALAGATEPQPFGLAQEFDENGKLKDEKFWVTLLPEYMAEDGEHYAHLPVWMQQAVAKGTYDAVGKPDAPLKINAGDAIGFLGEDIAPASKAQISDSTFAHIEVLCVDSRMPAFLDNPGSIKAGRKYIRVHPDAVLYTYSGNTFTRTSSSVSKDMHIILPVDKCNPKTVSEKTYYQAGQNYWLCQDNVDVKEQYYLKELGFTALVEESTPDMAASLKEGWMKSAYQWLADQVRPERGIQEQQMSRFYKGMIDKMDTDKDGQLSERELFVALHHPEMGVRDIVSRMIVKHESEWFGGSGHQKWTAFFQDYDTLRIDIAKKWLDDMEWMSQVEPFTAGKAVWHMHPVMFLGAIGAVANDDGVTYEQLKIIFPQATDSDLNAVVEELRGRLTEFKLDTPTRLRHFFSQIKGEVGPEMKGLTEKFQFSPAALKSFSKYYRQHPVEADTDGYERNSAGKIIRNADVQAIGRKHYLRLNGNRQSNPDDGYNFRGRGLIQITGYEKYNGFNADYTQYWLGTPPDTVTNPEEVNEMPYAIRSALWFWTKYKPYNADRGKGYDDVAGVTSVVNGGDMGLEERRTAYKLCEKVFL
ncbi:Predicted chitinase [Serratia plymuthica]|nr:Predicted chitinase [Serratia plymuthica]